VVAVASLQPALTSIPDACRYLGGLSRSRLYELMAHLDVVKFGVRTFVTIASLDRLIEANKRAATEQSGASSSHPPRHGQGWRPSPAQGRVAARLLRPGRGGRR
jgi:hypothetical protein